MRAIDHLVVGAASLDQGTAWCLEQFGAAPEAGGRHAAMGTHNRLLALGDGAYLEILAVDPAAPAPAHPRWFGFDDPVLAAALASGPRLLHWVARTPALDADRAAWLRLGLDPGAPRSFERDAGSRTLRWRLTVRDDGRLQADGALPSLIEWSDGHPAEALPDRGVRLQALRLRGLPDGALARLGLAVLAEAAAGAAIEAMIDGPRGRVRLEGGCSPTEEAT